MSSSVTVWADGRGRWGLICGLNRDCNVQGWTKCFLPQEQSSWLKISLYMPFTLMWWSVAQPGPSQVGVLPTWKTKMRKKIWGKMIENYRKISKDWGNVTILPNLEWEARYCRPWWWLPQFFLSFSGTSAHHYRTLSMPGNADKTETGKDFSRKIPIHVTFFKTVGDEVWFSRGFFFFFSWYLVMLCFAYLQ